MAHISSVRIANLALSKVGDNSTIESFTEDSTEAGTTDLWFNFAREQILAAFNWSFARSRLLLAAHSEAAPVDWGYRYQYPAAAIKVRSIIHPLGPDADPIPYEIELAADGTKCILTDQQEACVTFTGDVSNPSAFSPFFVETFATMLAAHIAFPLTGKVSLVKQLREEVVELIRFAPSMDAAEKQERPARDADHIRARV